MPSQAGGKKGGELGAELMKGAVKGLFNLGRKGASEAVKSDYAKQKIKGIANKYLDQALDRFTSDLSKKIRSSQWWCNQQQSILWNKKSTKGKISRKCC